MGWKIVTLDHGALDVSHGECVQTLEQYLDVVKYFLPKPAHLPRTIKFLFKQSVRRYSSSSEVVQLYYLHGNCGWCYFAMVITVVTLL